MPVKGLARAARSGDGVLDPTTRFEHAQRDIISPAPSVHFGQARQFPPVIDPPPLSIRPQDLVGGLVHRFLPSGHIAHKVHHIAALPLGQRFPLLLGYLLAPGPAGVRYGDADDLYQPARPVGIGIAHGQPLRHKAGHIGGQQATGALAVEREDPLVFVDPVKRRENRKSELTVVLHQGQLFFLEEQQELEEGISQLLVDELQPEPLQRHHSPEVHLDPPVADWIVWIRFPECGRIAVENVGSQVRVGAHPADARPHYVVVDEIFADVLQGVTQHI